MMKVVPLIILVFIVIAVTTVMKKRRPLQRGLVGESLVSTGQPAFAVEALASFVLEGAALMDFNPTTNSGQARARAWYAFYKKGPHAHEMLQNVSAPMSQEAADTVMQAKLLSFFVDADSKWQWEMSVASGQPEIHVNTIELDGKPAHAATFVLPADKDPWAPLLTPQTDTLVRRFTMLLHNRRAKLMVEYREPALMVDGIPALENFAALAAFEKRALEAFAVHLSITGEAPTVSTLSHAPEALQRRAVASSLGTVRRRIDRD